MKLYYFPTSPFVRKVMVLLHETAQLDDVEIQEIVVLPTANVEEIQSKNPLSKIPALERDEGPTIYDSRVICAYLDNRANAGLYGEGAAQWDLRTLEATADGIMEAAVLMVYEGRVRPEDKQWDGWRDAQWAKIDRAVGAINDRWMPYLQGHMNIGQIAVGCALGYIDFRLGDKDWRTGRDELAAWYAAFAKRDSMMATVPPA